jgi:hypothetical protein
MTESNGSRIGRSVSGQELRERRASPVILTFQPDVFFVAESPEQLRAWEELATRRFNVPTRVVEAIRVTVDNGGTCCESGDTNDCDAD